MHQYRYPVQDSFWEFPQGAYEENPEIEPVELALQELQEETGLIARKMTHLGYLYEAYGFSSQGFHVFLAEDFTQGKQQLEKGEQGLQVQKFSVKDFEKMIQNGEIKDAPTVSAYALLKLG